MCMPEHWPPQYVSCTVRSVWCVGACMHTQVLEPMILYATCTKFSVRQSEGTPTSLSQVHITREVRFTNGIWRNMKNVWLYLGNYKSHHYSAQEGRASQRSVFWLLHSSPIPLADKPLTTPDRRKTAHDLKHPSHPTKPPPQTPTTPPLTPHPTPHPHYTTLPLTPTTPPLALPPYPTLALTPTTPPLTLPPYPSHPHYTTPHTPLRHISCEVLGHKGSLLSLAHNLPEGGVSVGNVQTDVPNVVIHPLDPLQGQGVKGSCGAVGLTSHTTA